MKYLSVCSGIEAATVAWEDLGWEAVGFSEIEKFPSQLLQHHYPNVTNFGDMTKYKEWNINGTVNLIVGGTPCQSFSIAGLRKGLEDPRGNLMLTYLGIAEKFKPKWLLWENVPGVLSSNGGEDFASLLKGMAELGYGFAYRILDSQYFGVPQRRRRVFVVGCLGDWKSAAKVLFESESLCRNPKKIGSKKKEIAPTITRGFGDRGYDFDQIAGGGFKIDKISKCLTTKVRNDIDTESFVLDKPVYGFHTNARPDEMKIENELAGTLTTSQKLGVLQQLRVRRLTPMECERLQGFPDNYTNTPTSSDSARYKALGNSMAVPVMRWIGKRICGII